MDVKAKIRSIQWLRKLAVCYKNFMSSRSFVMGGGNKLIVNGVRAKTKICITGNNNMVKLNKGGLMNKSKVWIYGNNNQLLIEEGAYIDAATLYIEGNNCIFSIGQKTYVGPSHLAVSEDGSQLYIGSDCMFSSNVQIRTGDSHSILDENGNRINPAASVVISNHVWLGEGCKVLKGVTIGENSIVATGAIVTKSFPNNVLIGGTPAKVLKENVNWNSKRI